MRHVRIPALCLVALFALSAVNGGTALAETKLEAASWPKFADCPTGLGVPTPVELCFAGVTSGGKEGGFFSLGKVTVPLSKPVTLQGGLREDSEGHLFIIPATTETLESPELTVPKGLNLITPEIEERAKWSPSTIAAFKEAKLNKETGLKVKIELAGGNELYEIPSALNTTNLIFEEGPAFTLPLKVRMISPWLEKLGGGPCTVGNESVPIFQFLTTEPKQTGSAGSLSILAEGSLVVLKESRLADLGWEVPVGAEASHCGGAMEEEVDTAINEVLGIRRTNQNERQHGITILKGTLYEAAALAVVNHGF